MSLFDYDQLPEPANPALTRIAMIGLENACAAQDLDLAQECMTQVVEVAGLEYAEAVVDQFQAMAGAA